MNEYSNRLKQMNGLGSMTSPYSSNSAVPPRSRMPSASTPPSDEYLMALGKVNKAKGARAKQYYQMEAERIKAKG
tara:strand:- start:197 stop:421 length:225 start_codon:yes stop_codon:yes gene_type:complete